MLPSLRGCVVAGGQALALTAALTLAGACGEGCEQQQLTPLHALATASHDRIDFGFVYAGAVDSRQATLRSSGSADLRVERVQLAGDDAFSLEGGGAAVLQPGAALEVTVWFAPRAEASYAGTLAFETDAQQGAKVEVQLVGRGLAVPSCDDGNPCTDDSFDALAGHCEHAQRSGPCDDLSACTEGDRCVDGDCLGEAVICQDADDCTLDLCDPARGCTFVVDPAACDDDNPCTADSCDSDDGCGHAAVADGTPCGPVQGCAALHLCAAGLCQALPVPDGTPCNDGNYCTLDDRCSAGVCRGAAAQRPPETVGVLHSFGSYLSRAAVLEGGRLLFADPHGFQSGWGFVAEGGVSLTAVDRAQGRLTAVGHTTVAADGAAALVPFDADTAVLVEPVTRRLLFVDSLPAQPPQLRGAVVIPAGPAPGPWLVPAAAPPYFYVADFRTSRLHVVLATDPDAPALVASHDLGLGIEDLAVDRARQRLLIATLSQGLRVYGLADPTAPAPLSLGQDGASVWGVRALGDLVVTDVECADCDRLQILDAETIAPLSSIDLSFYHLIDFDLSGTGLVVRSMQSGGGTGLLLYNLSRPDQPLLVGTQQLPTDYVPVFEQSLSVAGHTAVVSGSEAVTAIGLHHYSSRVFDVDPESASSPIRELSGAGHGSLHTLVARPAGLYSLKNDSAHRIELSQSSVGFWATGAVLSTPASLFRLSGAGAGTSYVVTPGFGSAYWTASTFPPASWAGLWLDVEEPAAAVAIGTLSFDRSALLVQDGRFLFGTTSADSGSTAGPLLLVLDLSAIEPAFDLHANFDVAFALEQYPVWMGPTALWLSERGSTVAIASSGLEGVQPEHAIALCDVSDPLVPSVLAAAPVAGRAQAIATDGSSVVVLEPPADATWDGYSADTLRVFDLVPGAPVGSLAERSALGLPDGNHFLAYDGHTAFVSTRHGLAIVDVVSVPPRLLATIQTPQAPISAVVVNDYLYVCSDTAVTVVHPPCAPP